MLATARSIFDELMAQGIVVRNPAALVKSLPTEKAEMHTLDADQVTRMLAATAGDSFGVAWQLAVYGLCRGEILLRLGVGGFRRRDGGDLRWKSRGGGWQRHRRPKTKTKTSTRTLPMPDDLSRTLRAERKRQREAKLALRSKWRDSCLVVVDEFGNAPHPDTLTKAAPVFPTFDCTTLVTAAPT